MQPVPRDFERAMRYIHTDDFSELLFLEQSLKQATFAAAQIQHASRARAFQRRQHGAEALFVEAGASFDSFFFKRLSLLCSIGIWFAVTHKSSQRIVHQASLVF